MVVTITDCVDDYSDNKFNHVQAAVEIGTGLDSRLWKLP